MTMITQNLAHPNSMPLVAAITELTVAQDDLSRLSDLLSDAFDELLTSFSKAQSIARKAGDVVEMDEYANRAITAMQCEGLASQLIGFTQKRISKARESLKSHPQAPQMELPNPVWASGFTSCTDLQGNAPAHSIASSSVS
jgi:hypothetical protein